MIGTCPCLSILMRILQGSSIDNPQESEKRVRDDTPPVYVILLIISLPKSPSDLYLTCFMLFFGLAATKGSQQACMPSILLPPLPAHTPTATSIVKPSSSRSRRCSGISAANNFSNSSHPSERLLLKSPH